MFLLPPFLRPIAPVPPCRDGRPAPRRPRPRRLSPLLAALRRASGPIASTIAAAGAAAMLLALAVPAAAQTAVSGAGSTAVFPVIGRWAVTFQEKTGIAVDYRPLGVTGGLEQYDDGTVTFVLIDGPPDARRIDGQSDVAFPLLVDAVVPVANLPGLATPLTLDAATLGGLMTGAIGRWSDPRLAALNPGVTLPDLAVAPVVRADPAGETAVLTGFLAADPAFAAAVGAGEAVAWPVGKAVRGGAEVAAAVAATPGAVGYVAAADLPAGGAGSVQLKTADGSVAVFSPAGLAITAQAAADAAAGPDGFAAALAARRGGGDWPLAFAVVAALDAVPQDPDATVAALKFLASILADDAAVEAAGMAPLPPPLAAGVETMWAERFRSADKPLWPPQGR